MPTEIDALSISIEAKAQKANSSIDALVSRLDVLSKSLGKINGTNLNNFSSGMKTLSDGMNNFKNLKMPDFTRTAKGIKKFEEIDSSKLSNVANVLSPLTDGIKTLGNTSFDNKGIQNLINSLTRLSNANIINLSGVDFEKLGFSINKLALSLKDAPKIQQSVISMTNAIANLSKSGQNMPIVTSQLGGLGDSLKKFMTNLSSAPMISENTIAFSQAIASLSNAGSKAGLTASNLSALGVELNNLMTTLSKAPNVSENVIRMTNALANLSAQGSKVGSASNSISKGLNRASNSATRARASFGGLASVIGKFYATYFLLIRAFKGLGKAINSTADYVEAFNYFTVSMGKIASKWDDKWSEYADENARNYSNTFFTTLDSTFSKLSGISYDPQTGLLSETGLKNLGLNLQEVTQYAAQLSSMMDAVGQSGEVTLATTNAFVKLAGDISSLYNIDYQDAADKIRSVLQGQSRAGYGFGWDTTAAALQETAEKFGITKAVSEMAQWEKQQLRILTILEQSKVAYGDQSNTINTLANQIRLFKNNIKEAGMLLGQLFVPILTKLMPIINGVTIAVKRLLSSIAGLLGIEIKDVGQGFSGIEEDIDGIGDSFDDATASAKKFKTYTLGIDELNIQPEQAESGGSGAGGVGGGIDLTDEILEATSEYEKVWQEAFDKMENRAQEFADKIEKFFAPITEPLKDLFKDISIGDWFSAGQDTSNLVSGIFDLFSNALEDVDWDEIGNNIGSFLKGISWTKVFKSAGNFIETAINSAIKLWKGSFSADPIATTIVSALAVAKFTGLDKVIASKIVSAIPTVLTVAVTAVVGFEWGKELGKKLFPDDSDWYDNFKFLGEGGFFDSVKSAGFANTVTAIIDWVAEINRLFMDKQDVDNAVKILHDGLVDIENEYKDAFAQLSVFIEEFTNDPLQMLSDAWEEKLRKAKDELKVWYTEDVAPWFEKRQWIKLWENVKNAFITKWNEISTWWKTSTLIVWWSRDVSPWFTKEKWLKLFDNIKTALSAKWIQVVLWWNTLGIVKWYNENVAPWFTKEKWSFSGIKDGLTQSFNNAISTIKTIWNMFAQWINNALKINFSGLDKTFKILDKEFKINLPSFEVQLGRLPMYQNGGFPEDGLFMANRGELVGQFSNGKTAVANNEQIVTGIEYGVERAVERALAPYLSDIARNTRETADKDMSVNIGDRDIARANARGSRSMGYALIT